MKEINELTGKHWKERGALGLNRIETLLDGNIATVEVFPMEEEPVEEFEVIQENWGENSAILLQTRFGLESTKMLGLRTLPEKVIWRTLASRM